MFSSSPTQPFQRHILAVTHQFSVYLRFRNSWDVINRPQSARDKENGNTVKGWLQHADVDWDFRRLHEWKHQVWNALLSAAEEAGLGQQWGLARWNQAAFLTTFVRSFRSSWHFQPACGRAEVYQNLLAGGDGIPPALYIELKSACLSPAYLIPWEWLWERRFGDGCKKTH